jgi:hypothetical protein
MRFELIRTRLLLPVKEITQIAERLGCGLDGG